MRKTTKGGSPGAKAPKGGPVKLSPEDRARMARLYEETYGRLQEMALIVARNLGMDTKGIVPTFRIGSGNDTLDFEGTEIVCSEDGVCGCYDHDTQVCEPC